jgi:alpha-lytic protease prodomain-containing protein/trypsin
MFRLNQASRRQAKARSANAFLILALVVSLCSLVVTTASAAAPPDNPLGDGPVRPPATSDAAADPARGADKLDVDPDAAKALAKKRGLTIPEARQLLARERAFGARGARIESSLAGRSGGDYIDADGNLVVTTLDTASNAVVTRSGARAKLVDDSSARLDAIIKQLDKHASQDGAGAVQGWYVDVPTNSVVVTVTGGATDSTTVAITRLARSFGDSVRIEHSPASQAPRPTDSLVGGYEYVLPSGGTCSVGFNTRDAYNRNVVLTAGHCTKKSGWMSRNGYFIGQTRTANYPTDDFGTFWNTYPSYWQPSPSVYKYNGTYARLAGRWDNPPVGATVCKSGRTTGYTCGTIKALNQTLVYKDGSILYGLVRHNACVEPGDSGGSNISAGYYALGVTSGANLVSDRWCLSRYGTENVSFYQPVGEALSANGLRLVL